VGGSAKGFVSAAEGSLLTAEGFVTAGARSPSTVMLGAWGLFGAWIGVVAVGELT
jgi:hypothetical protein